MKVQVAATLLLALLGLSDARIWSLAIGHDWGGHEYFNDLGELNGFVFDLVDKVCSESNMDCRLVYDKYANCWQSNKGEHPSGGRGLHGRWYDGCMGWVPTVERIHTMSFSNSYLQRISSYFFFLKGSSFDPSDVANKNIGFLNGWASDEKCLARQTNVRNNVLTTDQIKVVEFPSDAIDALENGEVVAIYTTENTWSQEFRDKLDKTSSSYNCYLAGNAVIARKDSSLLQNWNVAFSKIKDSNKYSKLCDEWNKKHSHKGELPCKI